MKKLLLIFVSILIGASLFSQELSSISGSSSVKPGEACTYYIYFDKDVTTSTKINIASNHGSFNTVGGSTLITQTISGGSYFTVRVFWQDKDAKDGYIIAYKVNEAGKAVELKEIVISKDATGEDTSGTTPQPHRLYGEVYSEETFRLGFTDNDPHYNYSISDYDYDESLFSIVSKDDLGITFVPKQIKGATRATISIKIKSKFNFVELFNKTKYYTSTWNFPVVGTAYIVADQKNACSGSKMTYSIENFIGSYSDIKWTAGVNTTLVSVQNGYATFQTSGNGYANVKASIKSRGKDYNRENSEVWVGVPPQVTPSGAVADGGVLRAGGTYSWGYGRLHNYSFTPISYSWNGVEYANKPVITYTIPTNATYFSIGLRIKNVCGWSSEKWIRYTVTATGTPGAGGGGPPELKGNLSIVDISDQPEIKSVKIYNLSGALVYSDNAVNGSFDIKSTVLNDGIYIIEKSDGQNRTSEKVMLKR